ncbi:hypothetical protein GCM10022232_72240 [Streptomyces plumbiresistens]|uniref:Uncharacterized protein n=1 Tax=Streptomyces plumbiresistens TaxID=511811 RepID=A0ABP7SY31_9ACTN
MLRIRQYLFRRSLLDEFARVHFGDAVGKARGVQVVGDEDEGQVALVAHQSGEEGAPGDRVEAGGDSSQMRTPDEGQEPPATSSPGSPPRRTPSDAPCSALLIAGIPAFLLGTAQDRFAVKPLSDRLRLSNADRLAARRD